MARRRKEQPVDEVTKKRIRQQRGRDRREQRKKERDSRLGESLGDTSWLIADLAVSKAKQILDRNPTRPYWLSFPFDGGNPPISGFYPCTVFRTRDRIYYGFLFRDHRETFLTHVTDGRRELTDTIRAMAPEMMG